MASSVGDLVINVTTEIASVFTGLRAASDQVSKFASDVQGRVDAVSSSFKALAGLTIAGIGVHQFESLIAGTIEAQAHLVDLGSVAGTTAEKMSALIPAARLSGTSLETVASASAKFSKNLIDVQAGTGKTSEAFKALGLDASDAARFLKDPAQGLLELGQHLNQFADDGNKTAAVIALLGKNGAELLPFLKDLGDQSSLVARVTQEQAEASKHLADQIVLIKLASEQTRNEIVSGFVPALSAIATGYLAARANGASFASSLLYAFKNTDDVVLSITNANNKTKELQDRLTELRQKNQNDPIFGERIIQDIAQANKGLAETATRIKILTEIRDAPIFAALRGTFTGDTRDRLANNSAFPDAKPSVDFKDASTGVDPFISAMEAAQKAITDAQVALDDFGKTESEKTSPAMKELIDLLGTDAFAKFNSAQQQSIIDARLQADAIQHTLASLNQVKTATEAYEQLLGQLSGQADGFTTDFAAKLKVLDDALDAGAITLDKYVDALGLLVNFSFDQQAAKIAGEIAKINGAYQDFLDKIQDANDRQQLELSLLGQAPDVIARATAEFEAQARVQAEINRLTNEYAAAVGKGQTEQAQAIVANLNDVLDRQQQIVRSAGDGAVAYQHQSDAIKDNLDAIRSFESTARDVFESIFDKGTSTFKKIGDAIKKYLIDLLYQLTLKPFVISIAASLTGISQGAVANTVGGAGAAGNPLSLLNNIPGVGSGSQLLGSLGSTLFGAGSAGAAALGAGFSAGISTLGIAASAGTAAVGGLSSVIGALGAVAAPLIPVLALAVPLLGNLFSKKPSETRGQFQIGGTNFEDNVSTATPFGNVGFSDYGTQQFSGQAAQIFNQIVAGALDAFDQRYSAEQRDRLTEILSKTTFPEQSGTFTTEDFIKQYGGQVLQQVVAAAFDVLDPALGAVAAQFKGTADEVAKFGNTLLAVYDATKAIGNADFTASIDQALAGAAQESADKVLAFVTVIGQFGNSIEGLGTTLEALDPSKITAFVDALGGAQAFASTFATFNQNFGTAAQTTANATSRLTATFGELGTAVPTTHAEFVKIVEDFIAMGNTDAANAVLGVSDAFVTLHGTAEAARQAVEQAAKAGQDYFTQHFLTPPEQTLQRQTVDSTALFDATKAGTLLNDVLKTLGLQTIPTTIEGVRSLVAATVAKYGADSDEAKALYGVIPIIGDLIDSIGGFSDAAKTAADQISQAANVIVVSVGGIINEARSLAQTKLDAFSNLAGESTGDFGAKLSIQIGLINDAIANADRSQFTSSTAFNTYVNTLKASGQNLAGELAQFTILSAQYDSQRAEQLVALQQWYNEQVSIFGGDKIAQQIASLQTLRAQYERFAQAGNASAIATVASIDQQIATIQASGGAALDALKTIFDQKWAAIVSGTSAAVQSIDDFIKAIQGIADATQGNAGQQARLESALIAPKITTLQTQYATLDPTSALAKSIAADISKLQTYNAGLATELAHFTSYAALYGTSIADQLVALEQQFETWKTSAAGNADALAIVTEIFNDKFKSIVDGITDGVDQLNKLKVDIADYLKSLSISDLSPLTPRQQLDQSQSAYVEDLLKAQKGDTGALGDITKFADAYLKEARDFYASSQAYTDIFNAVTQQLGGLAGTTPTGLSTQAPAIDSHLPTGTLASSSDIQALQSAVTGVPVASTLTQSNVTQIDNSSVSSAIDNSLTQVDNSVKALTTSIANLAQSFDSSSQNTTSNEVTNLTSVINQLTTTVSTLTQVDASVSQQFSSITTSLTDIANTLHQITTQTSIVNQYQATDPISPAITEYLRALSDTPLPSIKTDVGATDDVFIRALPEGKFASQADIKENTQATNELRAAMAELLGAHATVTTEATAEGNATLRRLLAAYGRTSVTPK